LFHFSECVNYERELDNAVHAGDEDNPREDMNTKGEDHACDETRYFIMGALAGRNHDKVVGSGEATPEWYRKVRKRSGSNTESFMIPDTPVDMDALIMEDLINDGIEEALK
jgi:hypothetical protein